LHAQQSQSLPALLAAAAASSYGTHTETDASEAGTISSATTTSSSAATSSSANLRRHQRAAAVSSARAEKLAQQRERIARMQAAERAKMEKW
jgi:hypothetical protein